MVFWSFNCAPGIATPSPTFSRHDIQHHHVMHMPDQRTHKIEWLSPAPPPNWPRMYDTSHDTDIMLQQGFIPRFLFNRHPRVFYFFILQGNQRFVVIFLLPSNSWEGSRYFFFILLDKQGCFVVALKTLLLSFHVKCYANRSGLKTQLHQALLFFPGMVPIIDGSVYVPCTLVKLRCCASSATEPFKSVFTL